jgi:hypothetical protein
MDQEISLVNVILLANFSSFIGVIYLQKDKKSIMGFFFPMIEKQESPQKLISGLDGFLLLGSIIDEDALDRAMGKVKDLVTGEMYHLEMNPPPLHDTM